MRKIKRVLLIDDDYITNSIHEALIRRYNLADHVEIYDDSTEALSFLQKLNEQDSKTPELILLDIQMPKMNGFEFLDEFEKMPVSKKIVVFLLTTSFHPADMQRARKYNLYGYINKPLNQEKLISMFSRVPTEV
jgi:CheY-like chemotaxis protein